MDNNKQTRPLLHNKMIRTCLLAALLTGQLCAYAQSENLLNGVKYSAEMSGTVSTGEYAPFWLTSNKYGLSSIENNSGYIRGGIYRDVENDSLKKWKFGFGADIAVPVNYTSNFIVEQLYADIQYKRVRLSIGSKERKMELKNQSLSSGGMTNGINARPIPQIRLEVPDFWPIIGTNNWLALKGHIAYGIFTDNKWQKNFAAEGTRYTKNVLFHSKAGFLRIGNPNVFPVTITGGLEMCAQFGGEAWNIGKREDDTSDFDGSHVVMDHGISAFWHAFIPGGSDPRDGDYKNVEGNQLGSWHLSVDYHGKGWSMRAYAEHFFEDHSQLFVQYGWKDMLVGIEAELPKNPFVSSFVYEHVGTKDQTGGIYHDATNMVPIQISGVDNYYNHSIYLGWLHWGQTIGNPLLISPIYNKDGNIIFYNNRISAHHFGISGKPTEYLNYRVLFTHVKSWGSYQYPWTNPKYGNFFMLELSYMPKKISNSVISLSFGTNGGNLIKNSIGGSITIRKTGLIK